MNVTEVSENKDEDSSDSDIFVIKQIKPVSRVTLQDALIIKHSVLNSAKSKNKKLTNNENSNVRQKERPHQRKGSSQKSKKSLAEKSTREIKSNGNKITPDKRGIKVSESTKRNSSGEIKLGACVGNNNEKSSPTKITDYFSKDGLKEPKTSSDGFESVQLSPGISRRKKRFKINNEGPKSPKKRSPVKKSLVNTFTEIKEETNFVKETTEGCSLFEFEDIKIEMDFEPFELEFENNFTDISLSFEVLDEENFENNSELLSYLLKKIIFTELKKQNEPESLVPENGITPEKLLGESEERILRNFLNLNKNFSNVLVRMLCRKKGWHRVSTLNLKDLTDCKYEFNVLYNENFVDTNIENEDLRTQLNLLSKPEIFQLCKKFNLISKSNSCSKKQELINSLIEMSTKQKSVLDMLNKKGKNSILNLLKSELKCCLGLCVKLSETTLTAFNKIIVLFSFAHYHDEENKRLSNQLFMCFKVFKNMMKFPSYKLSPCVIFETRADFEEYEKALMLQNSFEIATINKQFDKFTEIAGTAEVEFTRLLNDGKYKERFLRLQPFLRKFSGGAVYARILTGYCTSFKKQTENSKIISVTKLLLDQNLFLPRKRGEWYNVLSKALENERKMNAAAEVLIKGLSDPCVHEVQRLTLQLRGQLILKRKSNGLNEPNLREALDYASTVEVLEPPSIEIKGQALQGNEKGYKCVYIEHNENGRVFSSVEEKAISYYRTNGFTHGFHVEGFIVHSMFFLFFYDVIYELSPAGTFQTSYQEAPLDFYSSWFYLNRKEEIDMLFAEMLSWSDAEIEEKLTLVYHRNVGTTCLVNWVEGYTPDLFCEVLKCLTMPLFVSICQRLVTNFGAMRSGFPDLTLWNPETKKCKFVEVKSPNDKLSPAQRMWLDFLINIGVSCEVCNVKNVSGKKVKS